MVTLGSFSDYITDPSVDQEMALAEARRSDDAQRLLAAAGVGTQQLNTGQQGQQGEQPSMRRLATDAGTSGGASSAPNTAGGLLPGLGSLAQGGQPQGTQLEVPAIPQMSLWERIGAALQGQGTVRDQFARARSMQSLAAAGDFQPKFDELTRQGRLKEAQDLLYQFMPYAMGSQIGIQQYQDAVKFLTNQRNDQVSKQADIRAMVPLLGNDKASAPALAYLGRAAGDPAISSTQMHQTLKDQFGVQVINENGQLVRINPLTGASSTQFVPEIPRVTNLSDVQKQAIDTVSGGKWGYADFVNAQRQATQGDPIARTALEHMNQQLTPVVRTLVAQKQMSAADAIRLGFNPSEIPGRVGLPGPEGTPQSSGGPQTPAETPAAPQQMQPLTTSQQDWRQRAIEAARQYGVPPALALATMGQESSFGQTLEGKTGDWGPMQITAKTAPDIARAHNATHPQEPPWTAQAIMSDPVLNTKAGVYWLGQLLSITGNDPARAAFAYNHGIDAQYNAQDAYPQAIARRMAAEGTPPPSGQGRQAPPAGSSVPAQAPAAAQAPAPPVPQPPGQAMRQAEGLPPPPQPPHAGPLTPVEQSQYAQATAEYLRAAAQHQAEVERKAREAGTVSFRFNPQTGNAEMAPPGLSDAQLRAQGYQPFQAATKEAQDIQEYRKFRSLAQDFRAWIAERGMPGDDSAWQTFRRVATDLASGVPIAGAQLAGAAARYAIPDQMYMNVMLTGLAQMAETMLNRGDKPNVEMERNKAALLSAWKDPQSLSETLNAIERTGMAKVRGLLQPAGQPLAAMPASPPTMPPAAPGLLNLGERSGMGQVQTGPGAAPTAPPQQPPAGMPGRPLAPAVGPGFTQELGQDLRTVGQGFRQDVGDIARGAGRMLGFDVGPRQRWR